MKYRFVTSDLLADILSKDRSTIYERLNVLTEQGYLLKQYDSTYRFRLRPASYCLAPRGIRYLKQAGADRTQLHYKNKSFDDEQIDEQLLLAQLARILYTTYTKHFTMYTKYQLDSDIFYLSPPPYLKLIGKTDDIPDYFMEYFPAWHLTWKIKRRINQHINYADKNDEYTYPHLLLVAGNDSTERRIARMAADTYADFDIFVTTTERLLSGKKKLWIRAEDYDEDEPPAYVDLPVKLECE